ncbi:MAG: nicotinamide-nucleotide adenylyltransferase [Candidatus Nanohaloarchaea archaeon]|jgi:nicotinamide-nucleotide adenylyltransferase
MKAVFLGRFQPFHLGHQKVIENYREEYDLKLVIGSADKSRTEENPLTIEEREKIIRECHPEIKILHKDDHEDDEEWVIGLEEKVDADLVISQNELVKQLIDDHTNMEVVEQELYDEEIYSGTEIRRRMKSGEEWRYLVPNCAVELIDDVEEIIKSSGINYEFEPGWKKENAFHGTADD